MKVKAFKAWRPAADKAETVASVPYDVVDTKQAAALAEGNPDSFLHVVRAEIDLPADTDPYSDAVYAKAKANLQRLMDDGVLIREDEPSIYLYSQQMGDHIQYGIVATCHIDDYEQGNIKIHEKTRRVKEEDRIRYVDTQNANTGPVFLAYRDSEKINAVVEAAKASDPLYRFTAADGVAHTVWKFENAAELEAAFAEIPATYVADGHHRSASAAKVGSMRRAANPNHTGDEPYNWFLAVMFPQSELKILAYNRVILTLPGTKDEFYSALNAAFDVEQDGVKVPRNAGEICMYIDGQWSSMTPKQMPEAADPVAALDVSILQNEVLAPILNIDDPRESNDIDFIGGIKGTDELEKWVNDGRAVLAFSMYPTSMEQLFSVADAGMLMPPKSTWFEPKLRSGLLVNTLD
ncbi:MAG: DUF1015 domain-containing protein [Pontiellaceae bacterium]|nr:DUF1015 domain-containing protein [Pontiellaceae bacterium]MBN2784395.1 DUF1015 domain-containing protein [Pontiellaceae bacterium]